MNSAIPNEDSLKSHSKYAPELFDIVAGKAYAKVSVADCEVCKLPRTSGHRRALLHVVGEVLDDDCVQGLSFAVTPESPDESEGQKCLG